MPDNTRKAKKILIGLGANLQSEDEKTPRQTLDRVLERFGAHGLDLEAVSPWFESEPVPPSDQPWFVNGVALAVTRLPAREVLHGLHEIEAELGRARRERWEARVVDLDLLDYGGEIVPDRKSWRAIADGDPRAEHGLALPHPRMHDRRFVLLPLAHVAPDWRHPVFGVSVDALIEASAGQPGIVRPLPES